MYHRSCTVSVLNMGPKPDDSCEVTMVQPVSFKASLLRFLGAVLSSIYGNPVFRVMCSVPSRPRNRVRGSKNWLKRG